nr:UDP-N-acetylmuramate dehydrogenase [uncultured Agathobacter sp.]
MNQTFVKSVTEQLPQLSLMQDEPMKKHTTFRIGGPADYYAEPDVSQISKLIEIAKACDMPVAVIGNGSNLLVGDKGIRGLVIGIGKGLSAIEVTEAVAQQSTAQDFTAQGNGRIITAGAGAILAAVAAKAAEASLSGLEFASGIPGSVGGAVVMNAGAYGGEIKDVLIDATVLTAEGELRIVTRDELDLSYRHSIVPEKGYIVLSARFRLSPKPQDEIKAYMAELRAKRVEKQPLEYPSAGSTFKRPEGYFAGKLIMDAGLRGYSVGDAQVSGKHCGFVVNKGEATAADVLTLIKDVQEKVLKQFGVKLEPEVKMIGEF